jgi:serine phosphatase RsbU (regulator of sigma subunit)/anti-sigma regulatory factor (Ser/Thr protein kinase)/ligand-binding sensor protein/putative methionine-R-sulfoxide reductase with GAF domain
LTELEVDADLIGRRGEPEMIEPIGTIRVSENSPRCLRVLVPRALRHVPELRRLIGTAAFDHGLPATRLYDLKLAASEACANAVEHATAPGDIEVIVWSLPDRVIVEVTNPGGFRPGLSRESDQRRRGLGLPLMAALADQIHVARLPEGTCVSLGFLFPTLTEHEATEPPGPQTAIAKLKAERLKVQAALDEAERQREALQASEARVQRKLQSILTPEGRAADLELADLIDVEAVQSLADQLYALTQIPNAIVDLKGNVLVKAGWQDICTGFHRQHPETRAHCIESDTQLSRGVPAGAFKLYECRNHLWDAATPILLGEQHLGNVFSGQFFFQDEYPDVELFRAQARRYGFDEEQYLAALDRVPRLSPESVETTMALLATLAHQLSQLGHSSVSLARSLTERDELLAALRASHQDLDRAQAVASTGSWRLNSGDNSLQWSPETYRLFGLPLGAPINYEDFLQAVHPDDRAQVDEMLAAAPRGQSFELEHRIVVAGEAKWVRERAEFDLDVDGSPLGSFGTVQDVTARRQAQEQLARLNRTLQALGASSQALIHAVDESTYLQEVCRIIVDICGHAMVWIGYAQDDEGKTVRPVAWAGFESGYLETLKITWANCERGRGPTGTAIRTGTPCSCRNMLTDPAFAPWRGEAVKRGYASSIVLPLRAEGATFGAVNIYSREPDPFAPEEIALLTQLADDLAFGINALRLRATTVQAERTREQSLVRQRELSEQLARQNEELVRLIQGRERAWHYDQALTFIDEAAHSSLAPEEIVRRALSRAAEALSADSAAVSLREAPRTWRVQHVQGLPDDVVGAEMDDEEEPHALLAALTGDVVAVDDAEHDGRVNWDHLRRWGILSVLTVPLMSRGETVAVMFFNFTQQRRTFSDEAIEFARRAGATISLALENARFYGEQQRIARTLQQALLSVPRELPGLVFGHLHRSATENAEVGGDFYDLFILPGGTVGIILGDVAGRGVGAANTAALVKNTIKAYAHREGRPAQVLADTNHLLIESVGQRVFVSAFFGLFDPITGTLLYASAGHPAPALFPARGRRRSLNRTGPVLGVFPEAQYANASAAFAPGSRLFLYTDGLTEARNGARSFGDRRLLAFLRRARDVPVTELPGQLVAAVLAFTRGTLADDVALLAIDRLPPDS